MAEEKTPRGSGRRDKRVQRSGPQEESPDLETAVEDEMMASGRHSVVPRTGLVGAHEERTGSLAADLDEGVALPKGAGSDVAPTRKAEMRERQRHQLQREAGLEVAGAGGRLRQKRSASRQALDEAAAKADELVMPAEINAEGESTLLRDRVVRWAGGNKRELKAAALGALAFGGAAALFSSFRRR
jgi:hypothetical protein